MRQSRRSAALRTVLVAVWVGFALLLAGPAVALPDGDWASAGAPLTLTYRGQNTSAAYGSWQGYREDQGRGSRVQDWSAHRMPGVPGWPNTDGAYVKHSWYNNGSYCYISSFSNAGSTIACSQGWHGAGDTHTPNTKSKSWQYFETWKKADPTSNSTRGSMRACMEVPLGGDACTDAIFTRGSHY